MKAARHESHTVDSTHRRCPEQANTARKMNVCPGLGRAGLGSDCSWGRGFSLGWWQCFGSRWRWWLDNSMTILKTTEFYTFKGWISWYVEFYPGKAVRKNSSLWLYHFLQGRALSYAQVFAGVTVLSPSPVDHVQEFLLRIPGVQLMSWGWPKFSTWRENAK